jgi:ParB family transcriptional regulator, chromosome partitioning protein
VNQKAIENIPIGEIRVANPRSRNKIKFQLIVSSIQAVGLKKPITVSRRERDADGTQYDLVCGQGRMEAYLALGESTIPAVVNRCFSGRAIFDELSREHCPPSTLQS